MIASNKLRLHLISIVIGSAPDGARFHGTRSLSWSLFLDCRPFRLRTEPSSTVQWTELVSDTPFTAKGRTEGTYFHAPRRCPGRAHSEDSVFQGAVCGLQPRKYLSQVEFEGETYHVGDAACVIMRPDTFDDDFEEDETCAVCGEVQRMRVVAASKSRHKREQEVPMLECARCLWGFHLDCLDPPLPAVPQVRLPAPPIFSHFFFLSSGTLSMFSWPPCFEGHPGKERGVGKFFECLWLLHAVYLNRLKVTQKGKCVRKGQKSIILTFEAKSTIEVCVFRLNMPVSSGSTRIPKTANTHPNLQAQDNNMHTLTHPTRARARTHPTQTESHKLSVSH